ncbi:MAG: OmpA family protein [Cytophagales bacterium]|nr:OmpA family protein [Cytophagales bacterium]
MKLHITILLLYSLSFLNAQDEKLIKRLEKDAKEYFRIEEYHNALPLYLKLDSISPDNPEYNYRIGVCYLHSNNEPFSLTYLQRAEKMNYKDEKLNYRLGKALHFNHQFDAAIEAFHKYLRTLKSDDTGDRKLMEEVNRYIGQCHIGRKLLTKPLDIRIENLGPVINSRFPDYAPVISADETVLIFTSRRDNTTGGYIDEEGKYFEDIYISYKEKIYIDNEKQYKYSDLLKKFGIKKTDTLINQGTFKVTEQWTKPQNMKINTETHDACVAISPDGQKLFTYKTNRSAIRSGDIYVSELTGNEWSIPQRLPDEINTKGWEPSCSISADEKKLFFSSDREGGFGGTDIYMSVKLPNGKWSVAKNIGPKINTPYDEDAPFIHPDGKTLYFSSKGHESIGGFDIFTSVYVEEMDDWFAAKNIGYPINTSGDDIFFVWSADGKRGYFSSVRDDSYGDKDIYVVYRPESEISLVVLKGHVLNSKTNEPIGATIVFMNNTDTKLIGYYNSNSFTGKYTIILPPGKNYGITVEAPGYLFHSENFDLPDLQDYKEIEKDILLDPIEIGKKSILRNVFFDYAKAHLRDESKPELERLYVLLKRNSTLKIKISGHTDNHGSHEYNIQLSQSRAQSVVDWLINRGTEKERLTAVGQGETQPMTPNENADGSDNPEGRQLNRRTEFEII